MQGEAKNYRKAGTVTPSNNLVGRQLGTGVYTASGPNDWPGNNNDWFVNIIMLLRFC